MNALCLTKRIVTKALVFACVALMTLSSHGSALAQRQKIDPKNDAASKKALPDLEVSSITLASHDSLNVTVRNIGKGQAKNTTVQVTMAGDASIRMMDWIPPLKAGESKMLTLRAAKSLPAGTQSFTAKVDPSNYVEESNEMNNTKTVSLSPAPVQKQLPDLVVQSIVPVSADMVRVTVKNVGAGPALKQSRLELRIMKGALVGFTPLGVRPGLVPTLQPGQIYSLTIPLELAQGQIYDQLIAVVDVNNDVAEANEGNNQLTRP
jgi:subtilase family serine protease